jgi:uncharacterized protein YdhG (YjbR/CyaY superfamily)
MLPLFCKSQSRVPSDGALRVLDPKYGHDLFFHGCRLLSTHRGVQYVLDRCGSSINNGAMSSDEITAYLNTVEEPKRATLQILRETILEVLPDAEQGLSYQVPAFRLEGTVVAGFAAFKNHLSYLPHSGSVLKELKDELAAYSKTTGALHFAIDEPLPPGIVRKLIDVRISQAFHR